MKYFIKKLSRPYTSKEMFPELDFVDLNFFTYVIGFITSDGRPHGYNVATDYTRAKEEWRHICNPFNTDEMMLHLIAHHETNLPTYHKIICEAVKDCK